MVNTFARFSRIKGTGKREKHLIKFDDGDCGWYDVRAECRLGHIRLLGASHHHHHLSRGEPCHPWTPKDGRGERRLRAGGGSIEGGRAEASEVWEANSREDVVGARVRVYWDGDGEWFAGTVKF